MKAITWSFGMQSRPCFQVGENPDLGGVAESAARAGMTEAIIFGKDHSGLCFHPTEIGVYHPGCRINMTAGLTEELHRRGLKAIAYVNFGMDGEMGRRHHDWLQQNVPGEYSLLTEDHFCDCCVFTPYLKEYMLPMLEEMIRTCHVDGVFLDTMSAFHYCCCPVCSEAFEREFHRPIPLQAEPDDPGWKLYGPWQFSRMKQCIQTVRDCVHGVRPGAPVIFNHVGGPGWPFAMPGVLEGPVSCDPPAFFPFISYFSNYLSSLPVTGDVFIERFARGWGDRGANDDLTMEYKSAVIFMYRSRFCVGDRMHPQARLGKGSVHAMEVIADVWKKMNPYLPDSLENAPDFLLLHSEASFLGPRREEFQHLDRMDSRFTNIGAARMMLDCGRSYMILPDFMLAEHLKPGRVLILPHTSWLSPETDRNIRKFLEAGGTVLAVEEVPRLEDGSIPDWLGIDSVETDCSLNAVYLPDLDGSLAPDEERVLVRGQVLNIRTGSAQALQYGYPQENSDQLKASTYAYYNSSSDTPMKTPLLVCNRWKAGTAYFLNGRIFRDYTSSALPGQRNWMAELLRRIHPRADFELRSESGCVEIASYREASGASVHMLVNHGGLERSLDNLFVSEHVACPQPAFRTVLRIRSEVPLQFTVNNLPVESHFENGIASAEVVMDSVWKAVRAAAD